MSLRFALPFLVAILALSGCVTPIGGGLELAQRPKPEDGQSEIELLAGMGGTLAEREGCIGLEFPYLEGDSFVTIVWPWNVDIERSLGSWTLRDTLTGTVYAPGDVIEGGGGFFGIERDADRRRYNRGLVRKLSAKCAAYDTATLNRDFTKGEPR